MKNWLSIVLRRLATSSGKQRLNTGMNTSKHLKFHPSTYGVESIEIETWNDDNEVRIGKYCSIGSRIRIILGGHNSNWITTYPFSQGPSEGLEIGDRIGHPLMYGDVEIGNDVWIGSGTTLIGGVQIGNGAIIAASSHVVSNVPSYAIFGGNPAKLIKFRFDPDTISKLESIQWWNFSENQIRDIKDLLCQRPSTDVVKSIQEWQAKYHD